MSLVPAVATTVAATSNAGDIGFWGHALIYIGAAVLFGLVGMLPAMAERDRQAEILRAAKAANAWTVETDPAKPATPAERQRAQAAAIVDAEFTELRPAPQLPGNDPRWGR